MDFAFEVKCAILLFVMNSKKNKSKHGKGRSSAPHKRGAKPQKPRALTYHSITGDYDNKSIWNLLK